MEHISIRAATGAADSTFIISCIDKALPWLESIGCGAQWGSEPWSENVAFCEVVKGLVDEPSEDLAKGVAWIADAMSGEEVVPAGAIILRNHSPSYAPQSSLAPVPEIYIRLLITDRTLGDVSKGVGAKLIDFARAVAKREGVSLLRLDTWKGGDDALMRYYERQGFTRTGDFLIPDIYRPGQIFTGWVLEQWLV